MNCGQYSAENRETFIKPMHPAGISDGFDIYWAFISSYWNFVMLFYEKNIYLKVYINSQYIWHKVILYRKFKHGMVIPNIKNNCAVLF